MPCAAGQDLGGTSYNLQQEARGRKSQIAYDLHFLASSYVPCPGATSLPEALRWAGALQDPSSAQVLAAYIMCPWCWPCLNFYARYRSSAQDALGFTAIFWTETAGPKGHGSTKQDLRQQQW